MTYNFDPERWYELQRRAIEDRRERGELADVSYRAALEDLERRYDALVSRLDKPFDLPSGRA